MNVGVKTSFYIPVAKILTKESVEKGRKRETFEKTVLDGIKETSPEKADQLKKQLEDNRQVAAQLLANKSKEAQSRKAEAAERIKRIKEQIRILKMMGADPKMMARQTRELARELASAAREYALASAGSLSSSDASANTSENSTSAVAQSDGANEVATEPAPAQITSRQQYQGASQQKMEIDFQEKAARLAAQSAAADADRRFAHDVRSLSRQLALLAEQQKRRLHEAGNHSTDQELAQIRQTLAEAEKSVSDITAQGMKGFALLVTV